MMLNICSKYFIFFFSLLSLECKKEKKFYTPKNFNFLRFSGNLLSIKEKNLFVVIIIVVIEILCFYKTINRKNVYINVEIIQKKIAHKVIIICREMVDFVLQMSKTSLDFNPKIEM